MTTQETIEEFFNEQFQNTSQYFLYKDKQLLKHGQFKEYAQEQIKKAKRIFGSMAWAVFFGSWYGITSFVKYGAEPNWLDLSLGIGIWIALIAALLYHAKEYYTIKSSMELFIKLIDNQEYNQLSNPH